MSVSRLLNAASSGITGQGTLVNCLNARHNQLSIDKPLLILSEVTPLEESLMSRQLSVLNQFNREYLTSLMSDIHNNELDLQLQPGLHSVRWIVSHIAIVADYGLKQFKLPFVCPLSWHAAYGPGSEAGTADSVKPDRDELMDVIEKGYSVLCQAMESASPELLLEPHEVDLLQATAIKTRGDLISHILTTHFSVHLGQLSALRRLLGRDPLF